MFLIQNIQLNQTLKNEIKLKFLVGKMVDKCFTEFSRGGAAYYKGGLF